MTLHVQDYQDLVQHAGHTLCCYTAGEEDDLNKYVLIECMTCEEIIIEFERNEEENK